MKWFYIGAVIGTLVAILASYVVYSIFGRQQIVGVTFGIIGAYVGSQIGLRIGERK